jgi:hypothetical protein
MGDTYTTKEGSGSSGLLEHAVGAPVERGRLSGVAAELIESARDAASCHAALAQLRNFTIDEAGLETLRTHALRNPTHAGCGAMFLAARVVYVEQLKAFLDGELESEVDAFVQRFPGTFEADALRHGRSVLSDRATESELEAAAGFFGSQVKDAEAREKLPHFQTLGTIAQHRAGFRKATSKLGNLAASLRKEGLAARSVILKRLSARY